MKKGKWGFTLVEVAIFLAITGALFVSVAVGVQNSVYQQRNNDAVQNFMEFLRTAYAEVGDVQNTGDGRSEKAIYGKLVTFGESYNLAGEVINGGQPGSTAFMYTVIGDINKDSESGGALSLLEKLNANVTRTVEEDGTSRLALAGIAESYVPKWGAQIEPSCGENKKVTDCNYVPMQGMVLIVRHPNSGTIYTYYSSELIEVNKIVNDAGRDGLTSVNVFAHQSSGGESNYLTDGSFALGQIDFCVNTSGEINAIGRMDVRIIQGAKNASGIELVASDVEGYQCGR